MATNKEKRLREQLKRNRARQRKLVIKERQIKKKLQQEQIRERDKAKIRRYKKEASQLRKQRLSHQAQEDLKQRTSYKQEGAKVRRYSISFALGGNYNKNFRAEVYTYHPYREDVIAQELTNFIHKKVSQGNRGFRELFAKASFQGIESETVGVNDMSNKKLNVMYFYFEDFV